MRRLFPMVVPLIMLLAACTPSPQPTPGSSASSTAASTPTGTATTGATGEPSHSPSTVPSNGTTGDGEPLGDGDEPGRYAYRCTSLDASPEVQLSSLAEVWAATNYTRMDSCEVTYTGPQPFEPTPREAEAISTAAQQGSSDDGGLAVLLDVLRLCTRVSDESGPGGFEEAGHGPLLAAASLCPDAPQGKIIAAWAEGTRMADGSHLVGDTVQPGKYQLVKQGASAADCRWTVAGTGGAITAEGGLPEAGAGVDLAGGQNFTSDKCGIWGKMY
ncbi:hypothetical protein AB4Y87_07600 [Paenarthrobacter sp. RAF54_2]|uniref:hypothetical protein n=1 Tax=Paenarthrobacter sp. RAF54_2 TaxID=3233061 RepID=UPI003F99094F